MFHPDVNHMLTEMQRVGVSWRFLKTLNTQGNQLVAAPSWEEWDLPLARRKPRPAAMGYAARMTNAAGRLNPVFLLPIS